MGLSVIPGGGDCGREGLEHLSFVFVLSPEQETPWFRWHGWHGGAADSLGRR